VYKHLDVAHRAPVENPNAIIHLPGRTPEQAERELIYRALIDLRNEVGTMKQILLKAAAVTEQQPPPLPALPSAPPSIDGALEHLDDLRLEEMERKMILTALKRFNGNRRAAAAALGISDRTLYRKLTDYSGEMRDEGVGDDGER
jgi:DNA-binding NtrC family response regulator